jgi:hypothetical protein
MNVEDSKTRRIEGSRRTDIHPRPWTTGVVRYLGLVLAGLVCTSGVLFMSPTLASASSKSSAACSILDNSLAGSKFDKQIAADEQSKNVAGMKQLFLNLANDIEKLSAPTPAALKSTPSSVQSAIKTIGRATPQLKTALEKATTESQLIAAFGVWGRAAGVPKAETTLNNYIRAACKG